MPILVFCSSLALALPFLPPFSPCSIFPLFPCAHDQPLLFYSSTPLSAFLYPNYPLNSSPHALDKLYTILYCPVAGSSGEGMSQHGPAEAPLSPIPHHTSIEHIPLSLSFHKHIINNQTQVFCDSVKVLKWFRIRPSGVLCACPILGIKEKFVGEDKKRKQNTHTEWHRRTFPEKQKLNQNAVSDGLGCHLSTHKLPLATSSSLKPAPLTCSLSQFPTWPPTTNTLSWVGYAPYGFLSQPCCIWKSKFAITNISEILYYWHLNYF